MARTAVVTALAAMLAVGAPAQVSAPAQPAGQNVAQALALLEQTSQAALVDLASLRIDKWKNDGKDQGRQYAQSIQQNMVAALPGMIAAVRGGPENLSANFKLYRNLNVLYDVFASLTELAGAFGPKEDYRLLSPHLQNLDAVRRALADRMEYLAQAKDIELARLRSQGRPAASGGSGVKRIVVDDNEPPKKRKKPAPTTQQ